MTNKCWQGIAKRLVKMALQEAAKKREMRYSDLKKIERGVRRHFHDDITVIVVFLDAKPGELRGTGSVSERRGCEHSQENIGALLPTRPLSTLHDD